jgi:hypothetical protein
MCSHCSKPLWTKDEVIAKLLNRINGLDSKYQQEIKNLKKDISDFRNIEESTSKSIVVSGEKLLEIKEEVKQIVPAQDKITTTVVHPKVVPQHVKITTPRTSSKFSLKIKELLNPIYEGIEFVFEAYAKYKSEGKLPIFFMTIAGIIAILFGFGYLMQLSLIYLGAYQILVKIGLGFITAIVLGAIGIRLSRKEKILKEYGAALIALGIILNYLMIYFMSDLGDFPIFSSGVLGFSLICINTLVSIYFSLKYDSKVIAIISLIGGAFTPLYLNAMGDGTLYYLYLWFLAVGSSYVSRKKEWEKLNYVTFAVILGSLEFMVFNHSPNNIVYALYYHLFTYLFIYISLFDGLQLKQRLKKSDLIILASSLSFFVYNLFSAFENNFLLLGIVYTCNGLVFSTLLLMKWKELNRKTKLVLFVVIGTLIGFAIPSLFDQKLMGLFWSLEALLLVVLGFNFGLPTVRKEGYILLAIAFGKLVFGSLLILENWDETLWHQGFLNYIVLGAVFTSMWFVGRKHNKELVAFEHQLYFYVQEIVPLWFASVYLIVGCHLVNEWIFNLSVIPVFGFIYWKKYFNTKSSDLIGLGHLVLFIVAFLFSIRETGSLHFSDQKLFAQLAMVELLGSLWVLKYYYKTLKIEESNTFVFAQKLRITFFCLLPLILANFVRRGAFEFIELGLWVSTLITYFLFKKLKYQALKIEFYILSIVAFWGCFLERDLVGFISGILFIGIIVLSEKAIPYKTLLKSPVKKYITMLPFVGTIFIGNLIYSIDGEYLALSLSVSSFVLLMLVYFYDKIGPIKENYKIAANIGLFLNLASILTVVFFESICAMLFSIMNLIVYALLLNNKKNWFAVLYDKRWNVGMILHQIETVIAIGIILVFVGINITGPIPSIVLAIHAIVVLFVALKNQIKVLNKISLVLFAATLLKVVFLDINGFSATEKVIVLIILGLILLSASYGYVKLTKYFENKLTENSKEETETTTVR